MTAALVLQLLGGAGFLAGVAALLHFLNTRQSTRSKGSAEAYQAYRTFVTGAFDDAARVNTGLMTERDKLNTVRALLIDLVQELITQLRERGATPDDVVAYQDRLDEVRAL
ncbi:hypothetical protein SEA_WEST99_20 [Mycobacterium phage West99]|uniref:Uncharacterized protein n=28 Tax=Rosebushvirus TaxID=1982900 RepID=A0A0Y0AA38_9CAUD|nr:gp20 [Mycobacterium phage Rosebush]YP_009667174.1 hypothetical protein FPF50_gp20 [Mycobacterium phage TA17A]YP_010012388.1 hypothetical protein J3996_gp20 [Mycobacterium phage Laurie]YP_655699.1 gp19 [Mycobacterium phage Qyrzula]AEN79523.1 hypothetical protein ARBITER_20 [Mycobacterium phage Arbiter]AER47252.1 hypothetical protein HEDGEROW_20 [Mycobacterium phage Hedgerow]AER48642.1 hypothetical protein ARES_20 [Mycobacterium phage Ares]AIK68794.1 hypothetical protein PBI_LIZLEMON_20 [My